MSVDPFQVRMDFVELLRRLSASQHSVQKVVSFAVKYFDSCGEDIWDCIIEETSKAENELSVNSRINILYFLDTLCETSIHIKSHARSERQRAAHANGLYVQFIARDLNRVIDGIVPEGRKGLPNLISSKQILENWRSKRYMDTQKIDDILLGLESRQKAVPTEVEATPAGSTQEKVLSRSEVTKRIEQDRERHKRLREKRWVQPTSRPTFQPPQLACLYPLAEPVDGQHQELTTLDIEFENEWEVTSDWNDDDEEHMSEEYDLAAYE